MAVIGAIRHRFFLLLRSEQGMALPTAIFALVASFGFATAAILSSVSAQRGTHRDSASNQAIAAADAGASVALMRMNRFLGGLSSATPCITPAGLQVPQDGTGWCPWTSTESVGAARFRYRVSAFQEGAPLTVVAAGTSGPVTRRVEVGLVSYDGENVFSEEQLIGESGITLDGTPYVDADIGTNGDVDSKGGPEVCGDIRHGIGKDGPDPDCGGEKQKATKRFPRSCCRKTSQPTTGIAVSR